jgi:CBS domain-containing protein
MFLDADPVEAIMTRADQLVVIDERARVEVARHRARASGAHHVLVTSEGEAVGVVSADRLARSSADAAVGERVMLPVRVVGKTASLAAVARILGDRGLDYLLVVDGEEVRGIVTRADLRRANIPCDGQSRPCHRAVLG